MLLMMLWGNFDFVVLSGILLINACMNLFGDLHETMNAGKEPEEVDWTAFIYGGIAGAVTWVVLWARIATDKYKSEYPWYAWAYVISYQALFFTFPIVMYN